MTGSKSCLHSECHYWKQAALHQPGQSSHGLRSDWRSVVAAAVAETVIVSAAAAAAETVIESAAAETDPQMVELHHVPQPMNHSYEET